MAYCSKWKGYPYASSYDTGGHSGPCALFSVDAKGKVAGRRWDTNHGSRMAQITVGVVVPDDMRSVIAMWSLPL